MKVLYIAAECKPFSKVGGVGDVAGELPPALQKEGLEIEIITPLYGHLRKKDELLFQEEFLLDYRGKSETIQIHHGRLDQVPVYFVKNETYFENEYLEPYINSPEIAFWDDIQRFSFFSEVCLKLVQRSNPDLVHINDWALCYLFGRMVMENLPAKRVLTIHNIGYQGNIGKMSIQGWPIESLLNDPRVGTSFEDPRTEWNSVNALRLGLELAHAVNTVSPTYCKEITEPEDQGRYFEGGKGLDEITRRIFEQGRLIGILNGYEYPFPPTEVRFQETLRQKRDMKLVLSKEFKNPDALLLGFVGRAVEQKFKLLTERVDGKSVLEHILDLPDINVAVLTTGLPEYEKLLRNLIGKDNYSATIKFDPAKGKQISLGSDIFLMPSLFEPCGITQLESLSHATPPLVRWTGGLVDTVRDHKREDGTGFGFDGGSRDEILRNQIQMVKEAIYLYKNNPARFRQMQHRGFNERFLWPDTARRYIRELYEPALRQ